LKRRFFTPRINQADTIVVYDLSNLAYRSWHGYPYMEYKGNPVHHLFGTLRSLVSFFNLNDPLLDGNIALVFAVDGDPLWRSALYPEYKKNREHRINPVPAVVKLFANIPNSYRVVSPLDEADDVIAWLCHKFKDKDIVVVSSDKDLWQLTESPNVHFYDNRLKQYIGESTIQKDFGFSSPGNIGMFKALFGDKGDNIKPVAPNIRRSVFVKALNDYDTTTHSIESFFKYLKINGLKKGESRILDKLEEVKTNYTIVRLSPTHKLHSPLKISHNTSNTLKPMLDILHSYRIVKLDRKLELFLN